MRPTGALPACFAEYPAAIVVIRPDTEDKKDQIIRCNFNMNQDSMSRVN